MAIKDFDKNNVQHIKNELSNIDLAKEFTLPSEVDGAGNYQNQLVNLQNTSLREFYRGGATAIANQQNSALSRVSVSSGLVTKDLERGPIPTFSSDPLITLEQSFNAIPLDLTFSTANQYDDVTSPDPSPGLLQSIPRSVIYRDVSHAAANKLKTEPWNTAGWGWDAATPGESTGEFANPAGFIIVGGLNVATGLPFVRDGVNAVDNGLTTRYRLDGSDEFIIGQDWYLPNHTIFKTGYGGVLTDDIKRNPSGNTATWHSGNRNNNYMEFGFSGGGSIFTQPAATGEQFFPKPLPDFLTIFDDHGGEEVFRFDDATLDFFEDTNFFPFGRTNNITSYIWPNLSDEFMERFTLANNNNKPPVITYTAKADENFVKKVYNNKEIKAPNSTHSGATPGPGDGLQFGSAMAISDDGNTMVVGAGGNDSNFSTGGDNIAGRIHIYERGGPDNEFLRVKTLTDPSFASKKNTGFGGRPDKYDVISQSRPNINETRDLVTTPIAISGDYIFVGASNDASGGKVHVYRKISGTWTFSQTLVSATATHGAGNGSHPLEIAFGESVAAHGIYLIIGSRNYKYTGRVFVYKRSGTTYSLFQTMVAPFGEGASFTYSNYYKNIPVHGGKYQQHDKLASGSRWNTGNGNRGFGYSVDISGNYIAVSAPGVDHQTIAPASFDRNENNTRYLYSIRGSVYVYKLNSGQTEFELQQTLNLPASEHDGMRKIYNDLADNKSYEETININDGYIGQPPTRIVQTLNDNSSYSKDFMSDLLYASLPDVYGLKVQIRCDTNYLDADSPSEKGVLFINRNDYNIRVNDVLSTYSSGDTFNAADDRPAQSLANGYVGGGFFPAAGSIDMWTLDSSETTWTRGNKIVSPLEPEEINFIKNLGTIGLTGPKYDNSETGINKAVPNIGGSDFPNARRQFGYNFDVTPDAKYLTAIKLSDENKSFFVVDPSTANQTIDSGTTGFVPRASRNPEPGAPKGFLQDFYDLASDALLGKNVYGQPITGQFGSRAATPNLLQHSISPTQVSYFRSPTPEVFQFTNLLEDDLLSTQWIKLGSTGKVSRDVFSFMDNELRPAAFRTGPQAQSSFGGNYKLNGDVYKHIASDNGEDTVGMLPGLGGQSLSIRDGKIYAAINTGESESTRSFPYVSITTANSQENAIYEFNQVNGIIEKIPNEIKIDNFYSSGKSGLKTSFTVGSKTSSYTSSVDHPALNYVYGYFGSYGPGYANRYPLDQTFAEGELQYYGFDAGAAQGSYYKNYDQSTLTAWGRTEDAIGGVVDKRITFTVYSNTALQPAPEPYFYLEISDVPSNDIRVTEYFNNPNYLTDRRGQQVPTYNRVNGDYIDFKSEKYEILSINLQNINPVTGLRRWKVRVDKDVDYTRSSTIPNFGETIYIRRPTEQTIAAGYDNYGRLAPPGATTIRNDYGIRDWYNNSANFNYNAYYGNRPGRFEDTDINKFGYSPGTVRDVKELFSTTGGIGSGLSTFVDNNGTTQTIVMLMEVVHGNGTDNRDKIDDFPFIQARGKSGPKGEWTAGLGNLDQRDAAEKYAWTGITLSLAGIMIDNTDNTFRELKISMNGADVILLRSDAIYNPRFNGSSHWTWPEPSPRKKQPGHTVHASYVSVLNTTGTATIEIS